MIDFLRQSNFKSSLFEDICVLLESLRHRSNRFNLSEDGHPPDLPANLHDWLTSIDLTQYIQNFKVLP